eukprot:GHVS01064123.1.p3 GENE.GHVS01064123.1~~GHVS01064123.1.p3  ORF type:complete len:128 (-),score=39.24 GHVS01064123.1:1507-1890(-)
MFVRVPLCLGAESVENDAARLRSARIMEVKGMWRALLKAVLVDHYLNSDQHTSGTVVEHKNRRSIYQKVAQMRQQEADDRERKTAASGGSRTGKGGGASSRDEQMVERRDEEEELQWDGGMEAGDPT